MNFITPPELISDVNPELALIYRQAMDNAWQAYRQLLQAGIKPELARYVLPNACSTEIICTWNFREIRHIITLRESPAALPEFRQLAETIKAIMQEQVPAVFDDL